MSGTVWEPEFVAVCAGAGVGRPVLRAALAYLRLDPGIIITVISDPPTGSDGVTPIQRRRITGMTHDRRGHCGREAAADS
eukprot:2720098-Rhodomonas_salina.1